KACVSIRRDFPVLYNVSVINTATNGTMEVIWSQPTEIDTLFYPRPYSFQLLRANGSNGTNFSILGNFAFQDTSFVDSNLNTQNTAWRYKVDLYDANNQLITTGNKAASIFLTTTPADQAIRLTWTQNVPWENDTFYLYRKDPGTNSFVLFDSVRSDRQSVQSYVVRNLENFEEYCFYIESKGRYAVSGLKDPLLNLSNQVCAIPIDQTPPCLPPVDSFAYQSDCEQFSIQFRWIKPDSICGGDTRSYKIYFARTPEEPFTLITQVQDTNYLFTGNSIAGCFSFAAVDSTGNESRLSPPFCFDNCPLIQLPNVFSPNGDGINDVFKPIRYQSIQSIEFLVFDRWGVQISQSNTINLLWDGTKNGVPAPEGVYYYVARYVLDYRIPVKIQQTGSLTLLR
ncbi:MAG: gliding motility-associated C-terminal domain-containing protein, partial [Bacteroidia bacterium]|nr:gliding motility-associated C-terminal domain-containing protein [Bacteroidia bacterium]